MDQDKADKQEKKSARWALLCILAFFAVFISVDAYFVYKAINTHPGVVVDKGKFE